MAYQDVLFSEDVIDVKQNFEVGFSDAVQPAWHLCYSSIR